MKYKIPIIIALVAITAGIFASFSFFPTEAQRSKIVRARADTGIIPLGSNQKIRVTLLNRGTTNQDIQIRFVPYSPDPGCTPNDITCICIPGNAENTTIIPLAPGQAISQIRTGTSYNSFTLFAEGENSVESVILTTSIIDIPTGDVSVTITKSMDRASHDLAR